MTRIDGVDPKNTEKQVKAVLDARRPTILHGAKTMWSGLEQSGLLNPKLVSLVNRRIAALNGCVF